MIISTDQIEGANAIAENYWLARQFFTQEEREAIVDATIAHLHKLSGPEEYNRAESVAAIKADPDIKQFAFTTFILSVIASWLIQKLLDYLVS